MVQLTIGLHVLSWIRGEDLDIGNTERTTVSLVATDTTGRRRRQTMGTPFCDIMWAIVTVSSKILRCMWLTSLIILRSISANKIVCSWNNSTADMSGVVLVTVNNAIVQNNSVTYQYLNNPVYTRITPQQTIISWVMRCACVNAPLLIFAVVVSNSHSLEGILMSHSSQDYSSTKLLLV